MLEEVDINQLTIGQSYFINRNEWDLGDVIFNGYQYPVVWVTFIDKNIQCKLDINKNKFYTHISKEDYYTKVKEKYDAKCLNIILKRLVDETFQSDFL